MPANAGRAGTPRARMLSAALRDAREAKQIGVRELARHLEISPTQVSNWETGRRVPNVEQVAMILAALRTSPGEREHILELARRFDEPNWVAAGGEGMPLQLAGVVECERSASTITQWSTMAIPGLLQTQEYAREIMQAGLDDQSDIELRVMVRGRRKEVLTRRRDPVEFHALISEAALYETLGGTEAIAMQLDFLLHMGQRSNVSRLLTQEGSAALTLRRVATDAGCSTTVLYTMFGGKDGPAEALYRESALSEPHYYR